jgi:hypothetical protein
MKRGSQMETNQEKELQGINGWLLFFVIIFALAALKAIFGVFNSLIFSSFEAVFGEAIPKSGLNYLTATLSGIVFLLYLITMIGILVWKKYAKNLAVITVWFSFATSLVASIVSYFTFPAYMTKITQLTNMTASDSNAMASIAKINVYFSIIGTIVFGIGFALAVTLYFTKSRRVKNTLIK